MAAFLFFFCQGAALLCPVLLSAQSRVQQMCSPVFCHISPFFPLFPPTIGHAMAASPSASFPKSCLALQRNAAAELLLQPLKRIFQNFQLPFLACHFCTRLDFKAPAKSKLNKCFPRGFCGWGRWVRQQSSTAQAKKKNKQKKK